MPITTLAPSPEFTILDSGLAFGTGTLHHAWFRLADPRGRETVRAVALKELAYLPIETRDDPDVLGKQWAALRGLYNADVDFVFSCLGVFAPTMLGVVQFYGAAAEASSREIAAVEARRRMAAVEATLANYPLSRLRAPEVGRVRMLVERLERLPKVLALLGHPDPRQAKRGLGRDGTLGMADDDLASQQGEILLRGLARLKEDFVFTVTAAHIPRPELAKALVKMARSAGEIASRQRGSLNIGFSLAVPLTAALASSVGSQAGRSDSTAQSVSDGVSQGVSEGETHSWGHSVGTSEGHGTAHTVSSASTTAVSHTSGVSVNEGSGVTDSVGHSDSGGHTVSVGHTDSGSHTVSESSGTATSSGQSWSHGTSSGTSSGTTHSSGSSQGVSQSSGDSWSQGQSSGTSSGVSQSSGSSWADSQSQSASSGLAHSASSSHATSQSAGVSQSQASGWSQGAGVSESSGTSASVGMGHTASSGGSVGVSQSTAQGLSESTSLNVGQNSSWNDGVSSGTSQSIGAGVTASGGGSLGIPGVASLGGNVAANVNASMGANQGTSHSAGGGESFGASASQGTSSSASQGMSAGSSWGSADSLSVGQGVSQSSGSSLSAGVSGSSGQSVSNSTGMSSGSSSGVTASTGSANSTGSSTGGSASTGFSTGQSTGVSSGVGGSSSTGSSSSTSSGVAHSTGSFASTSDSVGGFSSNTFSQSRGTADTSGWADSRGTADSTGWADSTGQAVSATTGRGWFESSSTSQASTQGVADTESWSRSVSEGWSEGTAVSRSTQTGRSHTQSDAAGQAVALSAGRGFTGGFGAGLVPGISIGRSWQTEDDVAMRLTDIARGLESLLNQASMEGGFLTTALLFVGEEGERAAQALAPQAFHGPGVPTPVLTVAGDAALRLHALAFRPSLTPEPDPFGVGLLWSKWGTLLTPGMLAAYTAPNLFEEGTAVTVQEKLPPLAFYPELPGDVVLGHLVSPETGDLTTAPLRLTRERHFHTAFIGDTGFGKSVAAERLVYESTVRWKMRTIVLDFGAGWRKLLNAPGLGGRVEIRQLSPGGVRPLRWNPLQIGRHILPEVQWRAFCDIFGTIAKLGVRRQVAEVREALRVIYVNAGVLVDDPEVRSSGKWGVLRADELSALGHQLAARNGQPVQAGLPLAALTAEGLQLLAVHRSRAVGLSDLYDHIDDKLKNVPPRDSMLRGVLEGILFRLHPLVQGAAATQYAAGPEAVDLNELVPADFGVAVLEGGAFLDDFSKAFLLGWAAWHLYTDAVVVRMRRGTTEPARIQIVFEEANKILAGLDNGGGDDEGGGMSTAEQFASMWRDSRKYGIWLHLITQSPSLIPPGILSSCNNLIVGQLKHPKDRDLVIAALHRSEKGFVDEAWRRFLASLPIARSVAKFGYSFDRAEVEPCYIQPLLLEAREPSDKEIERETR
ncbi:MAG: serine-rich protein [Caldilineaceae bacterium]|nr:serine-rich protein [Caldilineaceae bacterium]